LRELATGKTYLSEFSGNLAYKVTGLFEFSPEAITSEATIKDRFLSSELTCYPILRDPPDCLTTYALSTIGY
jgi:hypothetical protein